MKLYKNVDIQDLNSIFERGILSLDESGNDNWDDGRRAKNRTDKVYLFSPIDDWHNTFPHYGVALLEVETDDVVGNPIAETDRNYGLYAEYIADRISPEQIKAVYIPEVFRSRIEDDLCDIPIAVTWCKMTASVYDGDRPGWRVADEHELCVFASTAPLNTTCFNYFRGIKADGSVMDIEEVTYII